MKTRLKIGEFAKLTGVSIKTVLHYHKRGLLAEPERSDGGYRLYGTGELNCMRSIKRLKTLGLSLDQIKGILGNSSDCKSARDVLLAMQTEMLAQMKIMEDRLAKIKRLLEEEQKSLVDDTDNPPSFNILLDILGEEAMEQYQDTCPELYEQERKLYSVLDDLQWGFDYQELLRETAEYFREYPDQYQKSLYYGEQITAIAGLPEDSPVIDELARSYGKFLKSLPFYKQILKQEAGLKNPLDKLCSDVFGEVLTGSQMRLMDLLGVYIMDKSAEPVDV